MDDPEPFREQQWLSTAVIGDELVQYDGVSETPPWRLMGCRRGALDKGFGPSEQIQESGSFRISRVSGFLPNLEMQDEMAARLVTLMNKTGLRQVSFDGLEGCRATGYGAYAEARFVAQCDRGWKQEVISDASRLLHFTWHIHTRMNWGEPWGAKMREGMSEYRFQNQRYFERKCYPRCLGWFLMRLASDDFEATTLDDMEWFLAKAAGYGAGFAFVFA